MIGCKDNHLFIWYWQNHDVPIKCIVLPAFTTMEISCVRDMIYTCSRNNEVCQVDLSSFQTSLISHGPNPSCTSMVILPAGEAILSGIATDNVFIYWELSSSREILYKAGSYILHSIYSVSSQSISKLTLVLILNVIIKFNVMNDFITNRIKRLRKNIELSF